MKLLKALGWVAVFLVVFGVFSHMTSLFVIGSVYITWLAVAYVAANPGSAGLACLAAVLVGYLVGLAADRAIGPRHRYAG
jgi:hypothetical protein